MSPLRASTDAGKTTPPWAIACLVLICALHTTLSCIGIAWGLPGRHIDQFLFGDGEVWSGEKIHRLANASEKLSDVQLSSFGADVDVDAIGATRTKPPEEPLFLTGSPEDVARIYLRYRLYTYQPDEMITMMALAGMKPGEWRFDPRLYQYGGLFIYPVGALIRFCGLLGLIDVRSDLVFYLDNPDEFGKFYVAARAYSAAWGLVGVLVVFALTRRVGTGLRTEVAEGSLRDSTPAGLIAALFFALLPVVVCMSHEGKPHLPGAVLMLLAVYFAVCFVQCRPEADAKEATTMGRHKYFWLMCVACGSAVGMVLSSWPICALIPLAAGLDCRVSRTEGRAALVRSILGALAAIAVYFATNPYALINLLANRDILRSNFGNSLAMYEVSRIGEGFVRVLELTVEGATLPVLVLGVVSLLIGLTTQARRSSAFWLLVVPAAVFFLQFVLIGAGKPAEYGRFGIFTNTALVIGCALLLHARMMRNVLGTLVFCGMLLWIAVGGLQYLKSFRFDTGLNATRLRAAQQIAASASGETLIVVPVEPAPYSCPPMNFAARRLLLAREEALAKVADPFLMVYIDERLQRTGISWAGKRFEIREGPPRTWTPPLEVDND